jgi:hypothetical protein
VLSVGAEGVGFDLLVRLPCRPAGNRPVAFECVEFGLEVRAQAARRS